MHKYANDEQSNEQIFYSENDDFREVVFSGKQQ